MNQELIKRLSVITEEEQEILNNRSGIDKHIYTEKKEMIIDCEKMIKKGKLIEVRAHTRFVHFPKHRHNYIEVIYMCQGQTTHLVNGNKVVLEQGDLLFLSQSAVQEIYPAGKDDIAVNFMILPEFFDTACSMMGAEDNTLKEFIVGALCGKNETTPYLYFHVADVLPIQNLVENMVWMIVNNLSNKRSCNQITMGLLLLNLLNHMDRMETGSNGYDKELTGVVLNYVEEHYRSGTLSELAEMLGYDAYWLSREIKKRTGKTYKELLQTKRMNQEKFLLANTNIPVNDIIESVGYDNTSYFYRLFKEQQGMTPKEFRDSTV